LRLETQNTIETLREEFDQLVKELAKYKKKDVTGGGGGSHLAPMTGMPQPSPPHGHGAAIAGL
jgi:hypothetical protein